MRGKKMKHKIYLQFCLIAALAILITTTIVTALFYQRFKAQVFSDVRTYAYVLTSVDTYDEATLIQEVHQLDNLRVTIIDKEGQVLLDTNADIGGMENHSNREEIKAAFETGEGQAVRQSKTVAKSTFYYAVRMNDGNVLRVATETGSVLSIVQGMLPIIAVMVVILFVICTFLGRLLTDSLLRPIEQMAENMDYVNEIAGEQTLTMPQFWEAERKGRDREDKPEYKVRISAALCFSNRVNRLEYYHNSSWLEHGGAPEKAVKNAFVYAIDAYCKQTNKYTKSESKITFQDVADCLVLVTNCFSTQTSYENQTKKAITNKFVQDAMAEFFRDRLHVYFIENKQEADRIADQVLVNKRSRESAEKARLNIKKKLTGNLDIANRVQKFVDCRTKDVSKREIYIVEGDSALGSVKLSRDAEFQGIMPVRGKILNCLKADYDRIFKSDIITDLIRVLGCGVEVQTKKTKDLSAFDLENLRWNKVIICTDADVDGYQIRTLILTMIYRLCPTLIQEGYVYIAESPLYEITCKDKTWFAYTDAEKSEIVKKLEGKKLSINRSKGLGENDPEMMWMTTMNPETRRLIKVMPEDMERTMQIFDLLLGDNLQGRKEHIAENGYKYLDQLDVS